MAEEVIGGFKLLRQIVTGQTSQVWEVVEGSGTRHFALKLLLPEKAAKPEFRRFLLHEANVGKQLAHPNIIRITHMGRSSTNPFFVMEFFPAGNLKLRIMHKDWDFIHEKAQDILKQTATALAFMNAKGWVHRDVKPDNILVNNASEVRLIDFALAKRIERPGLLGKLFRRRAIAQGTRSYMSPEQIRGLPVDGRADIYSFGASAYEIVTGRPPFRAASSQELLTKQIAEKPVSPRQYNPDVSEPFADLVLRMLAKKPQDRPKDFHEVLMALRGMRVFKNQDGK